MPRPYSYERPCLTEKARQAAVLEDTALRLAGGAVEDRVLVEVDARDRRAAVGTRLAKPVVDAVGLAVARTSFSQLEAARELAVDRRCEALHLVGRQLSGERVRREPCAMEDLVHPRPAD